MSTLPTAQSWANLESWGLTPSIRSDFLEFVSSQLPSRPDRPHRGPAPESLALARVVSVHRGAFDVIAEDGPVRVAPSPRAHDSPEGDLEAGGVGVGDWVVVDTTLGRVFATLPRRSALVRQAAGAATRAQLIAANVDTVFVVTSANEDFSRRRLERYRAAVAQAGAVGVVVLTKADLAPPDELERLVAQSAQVMPTVLVSAVDGRGLDELVPWLVPRSTVALVGSSGVGKSTLVNRLIGWDRQAVLAIRESDATGRHTTTRRELIQLPTGALLVDSPGLREIRLWAEDTPDERFDGLVGRCRFSDCSHRGEPGCAVIQAVVDGELDVESLEAFEQLRRELASQARRQDEQLARRERDRWKAIAKAQRARTRVSPKQ